MTAWAYYNEFDPHAAAWLRNLIKMGAIAPGEVDERDIRNVDPDDLRGFGQCHFFAGIGVWSYSLRRAGIPDDEPVWTGSCPCQGFSAAGLQRGFDDERHLWPDWFRLIRARRPHLIWGEQVASALIVGKARNKKSDFGPYGLYEPDRETQIPTAWLDLVLADMEGARYAMGVRVAPAAGVGSPQIRLRTFFVAHGLEHAEGDGRLERGTEPGERSFVGRRGAEWLEHAHGSGAGAQPAVHRSHDEEAAGGARADHAPSLPYGAGAARRLEDAEREGLERLSRDGGRGGRRAAATGSVAARSEPRGLADSISDGRGTWRHGHHGRDVRAQLDANERDDRRLAGTDGRDARAERKQRGGEQRQLAADGGSVRLAFSSAEGREERRGHAASGSRQSELGPRDVDATERMADAGRGQLPFQIGRPEGGNGAGSDRSNVERGTGRPGPVDGFWRDSDWVFCRDGRWRPIEPGTFPLVDGASFRVGSGSPFEGKSRQEMLRGYGNAIVSEATVSFIEDYLEATGRIFDADACVPAPSRSRLTLDANRKRDLEDLL